MSLPLGEACKRNKPWGVMVILTVVLHHCAITETLNQFSSIRMQLKLELWIIEFLLTWPRWASLEFGMKDLLNLMFESCCYAESSTSNSILIRIKWELAKYYKREVVDHWIIPNESKINLIRARDHHKL